MLTALHKPGAYAPGYYRSPLRGCKITTYDSFNSIGLQPAAVGRQACRVGTAHLLRPRPLSVEELEVAQAMTLENEDGGQCPPYEFPSVVGSKSRP